MITKQKIKDFYDLIKDFNFELNLEAWQINQIETLIEKIPQEAKRMLLKNFQVTVYVNNIKDCENEIVSSDIVKFKDQIYIYLLKNIISSKHEFSNSEDRIILLILEYNKEYFQAEEILKSSLFLINYTDTKKGLSINTKKLDSLYTHKSNNLSKNVQKSIITTLTGKSKNKKFIIYPACKENLINIDKISKKYLNIKDKNINISCPICKESININKDNITDKISIDNNKIQILCKHLKSKNSDDIGKPIFSKDLNPHLFYLKEKNIKFTNEEKIMFFINNYKHLIETPPK